MSSFYDEDDEFGDPFEAFLHDTGDSDALSVLIAEANARDAKAKGLVSGVSAPVAVEPDPVAPIPRPAPVSEPVQSPATPVSTPVQVSVSGAEPVVSKERPGTEVVEPVKRGRGRPRVENKVKRPRGASGRIKIGEIDERMLMFLSVARWASLETMEYLSGEQRRYVLRRLKRLENALYLRREYAFLGQPAFVLAERGVGYLTGAKSIDASMIRPPSLQQINEGNPAHEMAMNLFILQLIDGRAGLFKGRNVPVEVLIHEDQLRRMVAEATGYKALKADAVFDSHRRYEQALRDGVSALDASMDNPGVFVGCFHPGLDEYGGADKRAGASATGYECRLPDLVLNLEHTRKAGDSPASVAVEVENSTKAKGLVMSKIEALTASPAYKMVILTYTNDRVRRNLENAVAALQVDMHKRKGPGGQLLYSEAGNTGNRVAGKLVRVVPVLDYSNNLLDKPLVQY